MTNDLDSNARKELPVCRECGSTEVLADAYAAWNVSAQQWEIDNVFDKGAYCNRCDSEASLMWVAVDEVSDTKKTPKSAASRGIFD